MVVPTPLVAHPTGPPSQPPAVGSPAPWCQQHELPLGAQGLASQGPDSILSLLLPASTPRGPGTPLLAPCPLPRGAPSSRRATAVSGMVGRGCCGSRSRWGLPTARHGCGGDCLPAAVTTPRARPRPHPSLVLRLSPVVARLRAAPKPKPCRGPEQPDPVPPPGGQDLSSPGRRGSGGGRGWEPPPQPPPPEQGPTEAAQSSFVPAVPPTGRAASRSSCGPAPTRAARTPGLPGPASRSLSGTSSGRPRICGPAGAGRAVPWGPPPRQDPEPSPQALKPRPHSPALRGSPR